MCFLPWAFALLMYIEAGRRTWQTMFLTLPERSKEPLALAVKSNMVPWWGLLIWYLFWGVIVTVAWGLARWQVLQHGRPSPLDLQ